MSEKYKTPDSKRAASKRYKDKNREKMRKQNLQYYYDHKDLMNERAIKYHKEHQEEIKRQRADYRKENIDRLNDSNNQRMIELNDLSRKTATNHRREWTPEDIEILIHMIKQGKSYKEISTRLGRTIQSIATRLYQLRKQGDSFNGNPVDI